MQTTVNKKRLALKARGEKSLGKLCSAVTRVGDGERKDVIKISAHDFFPCSSFRRRRRKPPVNDALDFPSYTWLFCYRCYSLSLFTAAVSVGVLQVSKGELATANSNRVTFCVVPRLANHRCP